MPIFIDLFWKNKKSNREKNLMLMTVLALKLLSGTFANSGDSSYSFFNNLFKTANQSIPTTTVATTTTTTTTTTAKPVAAIKRCGLLKDRICVKRSQCLTARSNNPKLVIDLKKPSLSGCHYLEACCHPKDTISPADPSIALEFEQCGVSNVGGLFMTVKGGEVESSFAEFPWTVAILDVNQEFLCSGALISDKVIVTTATCLFPEQQLSVRAGDWDLRTDMEPVPHETRIVEKRIIHQLFSWESTSDNIAMLILEKALPNLRHIVPVCLDNGETYLEFENCYVSGWHVRRSSQSPVPRREIVLKIKIDLPSKPCGSSTSKELCGFIQTQRPVVANGAPLVCPTEDNRYHLVGAWSVGINATLFTDVRQYSQWIKEQLAKHNIEIERL